MEGAQAAGVFWVAHGACFDTFNGIDSMDDVQKSERIGILCEAKATCDATLRVDDLGATKAVEDFGQVGRRDAGDSGDLLSGNRAIRRCCQVKNGA